MRCPMACIGSATGGVCQFAIDLLAGYSLARGIRRPPPRLEMPPRAGKKLFDKSLK
uniref:Uncharacterized protein n=1 Tax=Arundo donax TaxID=35708 RepID=A0A0A9EYP0_ARUDO